MSEPPAKTDLAAAALRDARATARRNRRTTGIRVRSRLDSGRRTPVPLAVTVIELLERRGVPTPAAAAVVTRWPQIAGPAVAAGLQAVAFDAATGTLTLQTASPAWMVQGRLLTRQLIEQVNQQLGTDTIRALRFRQPIAAQSAADPLPAARSEEDQQIQDAIRRQNTRAVREPSRSLIDMARRAERPYAQTVRLRALQRARSQTRDQS